MSKVLTPCCPFFLTECQTKLFLSVDFVRIRSRQNRVSLGYLYWERLIYNFQWTIYLIECLGILKLYTEVFVSSYSYVEALRNDVSPGKPFIYYNTGMDFNQGQVKCPKRPRIDGLQSEDILVQ